MKKMIPIEKMQEIEDWLHDNEQYFNVGIDEQELLYRLKLKVEYLDDGCFHPNTEAELCATDDVAYNGLIRINKKYNKGRFACIHEIIHYLQDVGIGNKVVKTYARKTKGNTTDQHEQEINYTAAAAILKYDMMKSRIYKYDTTRPKMDELKFVNDICVEYNQNRTTVIRRIREVRALMKKNNVPTR